MFFALIFHVDSESLFNPNPVYCQTQILSVHDECDSTVACEIINFISQADN